MAKGCGFIILCAIGLLGISMLYYSLSPYLSEETPSFSDNVYTSANVYDVISKDDETDSAYLKIIPLIEYRYNDSLYSDTAYNLARTTEKDGYFEEIGSYYYKEGDKISIQVSAPDEYKEAPDLPLEYALQGIIEEWQIGLIIVGSIFMIIFLIGLSKTFSYKEPPEADRF